MTTAIVVASESSIPSSAAAKLAEIPAEEITASLNGGSIIYDHVRIAGDLNLDQAKYESIKITNSIIEGNLSSTGNVFDGHFSFLNTSFLKNVTFFQATFDREADFNGSRFYGTANFNESIFLDGATFDHCTFYKDFYIKAADLPKFGSFYDATFNGNADFRISQFSGVYANFESSRFLDDANFANMQFNTYLTFIGSKFLKKADFHSSSFSLGSTFMKTNIAGYCDFSRCEFGKQAIFSNMSFNNTTNFIGSKFDGSSIFKGTEFWGNAYFTSAQFVGPSDFSYTRFDKNLFMNSSSINTMVLTGCIFNKSSDLYLAKANINRFMADWSLIKDILSFDSSAYLSLVKNYKDMGLDAADDCYYQYRFLSQESKSWGLSKLLDMLACIACGYGVRPLNPIYCSLVLIVLCTGLLWRGNGLRSPSHMDKRTELFDALYYCLAVFFTIPLPDLKAQGRFRYVAVFERALSWTLFALLIATLGKVMIK